MKNNIVVYGQSCDYCLEKETEINVRKQIGSYKLSPVAEYTIAAGAKCVAELLSDKGAVFVQIERERLVIKGSMGSNEKRSFVKGLDGFRIHEDAIVQQAKHEKAAIEVHYMPGRRLECGDSPVLLVEQSIDVVKEYVEHCDCSKATLMMDIDVLREHDVNISQHLSWDRTFKDFVWNLQNNRRMRRLLSFQNIIVTIGREGAVWVDQEQNCIFFYRSDLQEGSLSEKYQGFVATAYELLVADITDCLTKDRPYWKQGIQEALDAYGELHKCGYSAEDLKGGLCLRRGNSKSNNLHSLTVVNKQLKSMYAEDWSILKMIVNNNVRLEDVAARHVVTGKREDWEKAPILTIGALKLVDREEIENFSAIRNLFVEYINNTKVNKPLSIAVFGTPGSGKSFGVTQIAENIDRERVIKLEFNVSQFTSLNDLCDAFHMVRDRVLQGKIPLVFFDEFDSANGGEKLSWLKYFLAPMQDGVFKDGETVHPIGKCILVFAGGTCSDYASFVNRQAEDKNAFREAKGPDFVSRLRGYVNVSGPNPKHKQDRTYLIRRAMLLRSNIERNARMILDNDHKANINAGVLTAMLTIDRYKHGARSMEALVNMSNLSNENVWKQSSIPLETQLDTHVDGMLFHALMRSQSIIEDLAVMIHENYRKAVAEDAGVDVTDSKALEKYCSEQNKDELKPWDGLIVGLKQSNMEQALDYMSKLRVINCSIEQIENMKNHFVFSEDEVELLAQMEHDRWCTEKYESGYRYGEVKDNEKKTHPLLIGWELLPESERQKDRNAVLDIPVLLAKLGLSVYRLEGRIKE